MPAGSTVIGTLGCSLISAGDRPITANRHQAATTGRGPRLVYQRPTLTGRPCHFGFETEPTEFASQPLDKMTTAS